MSSASDTEQLNAFIDGELDLVRQIEIESLLAEDTAKRAQVESLRSVRDAVRASADYHVAPAALRARIQGLVAAPSTPPPTQPALFSGARAAARRWFAWRPLATAFGVMSLFTVALNLALLQSGREQRLGEEVVASHVRAVLSQRLVDVHSSEQHTVKPWLSSRLDFSPPVFELNVAGSVFEGARVDYLDSRPVAALVYKQGEHVVESFVWPAGGADQPITMSEQRGFHLANWTRRGMTHWLISDLNRQEFAGLARKFDAADEGP